MITLTDPEIKWIKHCKGHYNKNKFPSTDVEKLMPLFEEIYGWSPYDNRNDFLSCIFSKLLDIWFKIGEDYSGTNHKLIGVFNASFSKSYIREQELPIERAISELIGMIAFTNVIDKNRNKRFELN